MFVSIDALGRVVASTVSKVMFLYKATKQTLIEPKKTETKYYAIASKFKSELNQQAGINDHVTMVAVGNQENVVVFAVNQSKN